MISAVFIALVILVTAILITRHIYLEKIEALKIVQQNKINLDFRRGFDAGWESATRFMTEDTFVVTTSDLLGE